jgi:hypothetical protein
MHMHSHVEDGRQSVTAVFGFHQDSDPQALHAPVLVLNASYEPINICAARRAIVLVLKGVAMTDCLSTGAFRIRRELYRARTSCCEIATSANIAARRFQRTI